MALSAFDLYSVGIGPSSSHTVGPMRAARRFVQRLDDEGLLTFVSRVRAELFGSLGATGHRHGSDKAVVLGLEDEDPATVDTERADGRVAEVRAGSTLLLAGKHRIGFDSDADLVLHRRKSLSAHPNGMVFHAFADDGRLLDERTYYSVGGGFVVDEAAAGAARVVADTTRVRFPFDSAGEPLAHCAREDLAVSDIMLANEQAWRPEAEVRSGLLHLWSVMRASVERGCRREGVLPGGVRVPRRAPGLFRGLNAKTDGRDPLQVMDWVNLFALAVNEENASISGAEVGCQGEVGSACAMAAGALCEALGGTPAQVENAAEVGIEHNLGLTCDPVGGLVQIPCIERNAVASVKAINAARLALAGDGTHKVSLDQAVKTMRDTGRDMKVKCKETARGGLAVNVIEC